MEVGAQLHASHVGVPTKGDSFVVGFALVTFARDRGAFVKVGVAADQIVGRDDGVERGACWSSADRQGGSAGAFGNVVRVDRHFQAPWVKDLETSSLSQETSRTE